METWSFGTVTQKKGYVTSFLKPHQHPATPWTQLCSILWWTHSNPITFSGHFPYFPHSIPGLLQGQDHLSQHFRLRWYLRSEPTQGSRQGRLCGLPAGWFARQPCLGLSATSRNASGFDYPSCQRLLIELPPTLALPLMLLWPTNRTRKSLEISIPFTLILTFLISHLSLLPSLTECGQVPQPAAMLKVS